MRRVKKFAALGLSVMMVSAMAVGVNAAGPENQNINGMASGNTAVQGSGNIAVDGYLTKDAIIDSNGDVSISGGYDPSTPTEVPTVTSTTDGSGGSTVTSTMTETITQTSGNTPIDSNGSHVSWGDPSTADTTQLILSAPTKLAFQVAGNGEDANIQLTSSNESVKGYILNQSCYIQNDSTMAVVPKAVGVTGTYRSPDNPAFVVMETINDVDVNQIEGVYINLGNKRIDFATMRNATQELGTLPKGEGTFTAEGKGAVNPSASKIYFSDKNGGASGVKTKFASNYDDSKLKQAYNVQLTYAVK